ncbi:MAG: amidohydrolase family protein [Acidimicrobiales bacterium]
MRIDTHSHLVPPGYARMLALEAAANPEFAGVNARRLENVADPQAPVRSINPRLEEMDSASIDVSVLSLPPPGVNLGDKPTKVAAARLANDELVAVADEHPGRFQVLASLPFPHTEEALDELARVATQPAVRGVSLFAVSETWTVDDPRLQPVYEEVATLGLPIVLHPIRRSWTPEWKDWGLTRTLGMMVTSSISASRLILSGMLDRVPDLAVIMPHLGATLPYLLQRYDDVGQGDAAFPVGRYLRGRFHFDTCSHHAPALHCAIETVGVDRLVLGSDYPFRGPLRRMIDHIVEAVDEEEERQKIFGTTAQRWFGTDAPVGRAAPAVSTSEG